jgi:hypothetical protein
MDDVAGTEHVGYCAAVTEVDGGRGQREGMLVTLEQDPCLAIEARSDRAVAVRQIDLDQHRARGGVQHAGNAGDPACERAARQRVERDAGRVADVRPHGIPLRYECLDADHVELRDAKQRLGFAFRRARLIDGIAGIDRP